MLTLYLLEEALRRNTVSFPRHCPCTHSALRDHHDRCDWFRIASPGPNPTPALPLPTPQGTKEKPGGEDRVTGMSEDWSDCRMPAGRGCRVQSLERNRTVCSETVCGAGSGTRCSFWLCLMWHRLNGRAKIHSHASGSRATPSS